MAKIPESFIQEVLERTDVADVVGQYVQLRKMGINLKGLCPFHQEKTPSFSVSPQKQIYHCFGCGESGNAIRFLMKHAGMPFPEAVRQLASKAGLSMPELKRDPKAEQEAAKRKTKAEQLHDCLSQAQRWYAAQLPLSPVAMQYVQQRGLSADTVAHFGLGWSGNDYQALRQVFVDYQSQLLSEAGLVIDKEDQKRYDRFRERIMFPIRNAQGQMIGFGGRVLGDAKPKYLNSPETPVFYKKDELYGLYENRSTFAKEGFVLVVEGYMDVVSLWQLGLKNAVATLGTATSDVHLKKLMRISNSIVFSFDGDEAGRRAAWKALMVSLPLLKDEVALRFLFLPPEHDPDSYIRSFGQEAFREQVKASLPLSGFFLQELTQQFNLEEAEGRASCLVQVCQWLLQMPDNALRAQIETQVATLLRLTLNELRLHLARYSEGRIMNATASGNVAQAPTKVAKPSYRVQAAPLPSPAHKLMKLLLNHPSLLTQVAPRHVALLEKLPNYHMLAQFLALCLAKGTATLAQLSSALQAQPDLEKVVQDVGLLNDNDIILDNPVSEWRSLFLNIEIEVLQNTQKSLASSGWGQADQEDYYRRLGERIQSLRAHLRQ